MAYDADPSATHNPATGGTPSAAWGDILNANFAHLGGAWTSYTPTWSGTLGNGAKTGAYLKVGRTVHYRISVTWGSSTSHAAASQTFTLPAAPHSFYSVVGSVIGIGVAQDSGANHVCTALVLSGSTVILVDNNNDAVVTNAAPFTFATGDLVQLSGTYEAAA